MTPGSCDHTSGSKYPCKVYVIENNGVLQLIFVNLSPLHSTSPLNQHYTTPSPQACMLYVQDPNIGKKHLNIKILLIEQLHVLSNLNI